VLNLFLSIADKPLEELSFGDEYPYFDKLGRFPLTGISFGKLGKWLVYFGS
jgi:hypothetical protein